MRILSEKEWQLYTSFKQSLLQEVVQEVNVKQGIAITIMDLIFISPLQGFLIGSEPRHIIPVSFFLRQENQVWQWQFNNGPEWYDVQTQLDGEESGRLNEVLFNAHDNEAQAPWLVNQAKKFIALNPDVQPGRMPGLGLRDREIVHRLKKQLTDIVVDNLSIDHFKQALCTLVDLDHRHYEALAYALEFYYPESSLLEIEYDEIKQRINRLNNFNDTSASLDDDTLGAVLTIWIEVRSDEAPEGRWDAWV